MNYKIMYGGGSLVLILCINFIVTQKYSPITNSLTFLCNFTVYIKFEFGKFCKNDTHLQCTFVLRRNEGKLK